MISPTCAQNSNASKRERRRILRIGFGNTAVIRLISGNAAEFWGFGHWAPPSNMAVIPLISGNAAESGTLGINALITDAFPHYHLFQYQAATLYSNLMHHGAASWPAERAVHPPFPSKHHYVDSNVMGLTSIRGPRECFFYFPVLHARW